MPYKNKADQAAASRRHYEQNKDVMIARAYQFKRKLIGEIRLYLVNLKEQTPCGDCGIQYPYYVMQFDHVRGVKLFNVATHHFWSSKQVVLDEVAKCEIVCANCHAERTHQQRQGSMEDI